MKLKPLDSFQSINSKELEFVVGGTAQDSSKKKDPQDTSKGDSQQSTDGDYLGCGIH